MEHIISFSVDDVDGKEAFRVLELVDKKYRYPELVVGCRFNHTQDARGYWLYTDWDKTREEWCDIAKEIAGFVKSAIVLKNKVA